MVLQSIKSVRTHRPQHKVHHGLKYIDFLVHHRYLIAWYYCMGFLSQKDKKSDVFFRSQKFAKKRMKLLIQPQKLEAHKAF